MSKHRVNKLLNHQLDNLKYIGNSYYKFIFKVDLTISVDSIYG